MNIRKSQCFSDKKGEDTKYEDVNENTVVLCRTYVSGVRRSFFREFQPGRIPGQFASVCDFADPEGGSWPLYHWCVYNLHDCADHHQAKRV